MPPSGPFTPVQLMVGMAVFAAVYAGIAVYVGLVERDWAAFGWVTAFAVLALLSSVRGLRVRRRERARVARAASRPRKEGQHPPAQADLPPRRPRSRRRHRRH